MIFLTILRREFAQLLHSGHGIVPIFLGRRDTSHSISVSFSIHNSILVAIILYILEVARAHHRQSSRVCQIFHV